MDVCVPSKRCLKTLEQELLGSSRVLLNPAIRQLWKLARPSSKPLAYQIEPQGSIPGVDVNAPDDDAYIALAIAARHDSVNVARILIDGGADINAKDRIGATTLHWAARVNSLDIARLLIEHGANTDGIDLSWMN